MQLSVKRCVEFLCIEFLSMASAIFPASCRLFIQDFFSQGRHAALPDLRPVHEHSQSINCILDISGHG